MSVAQIIRYEGDNSAFIRKHPCEDFNTMSGIKFTLATLGNDAGAYGAFKLILDSID